MAFSKTFPRTLPGSNYPKWEEVYLTAEEELEEENKTKEDNVSLMRECIQDAKEIFKALDLKEYQTDIIHAAIALFEKRASHEVFYKERRAKEKFDEKPKDPTEGVKPNM